MNRLRIVLKWQHDEDTSFINDDDCHAFEQNTTDREFSHQVDILGTYYRLINIGGCTPEQARSQTSYAYKRLREWHRQNGWNYVGCVATLYTVPDFLEDDPDDYELSDWEEIHSTSVWGINSDCGDYRYDVEREQLQELCSTVPGIACTYTWAAIPGDPGIFIVEGERIEIEAHEDSWYMEEEMAFDHSDLLPEWSVYFELRSKGDSKLEWYCVACGETFDEDEITPEDIQAGRCPNEDCERYHYKYVVLYAPDGYCVGVLHDATGRTDGDWEQVLGEANQLSKSVINHGLDTYAHHTGCDSINEVPLHTVQLTGWVLKTYSEPWPSIDWTVGGTW